MVDTKIGLTIYLLKPDKVAAFESELKAGRDVRPLAPPLDGEFIPLPSTMGEPSWVGVIRGALQNSVGLTLNSQSPAGLLLVRRASNTFVLSFGHAWQKLENHWLIGSPLIDNLNASIHLRALLTDLFLLTEIAKIQRTPAKPVASSG